MQVLLLEDIAKLGGAGDIVETSEGYARNFLFPQGKAALATKQVKTRKDVKDAAAKKKAEEELMAQQALASKMENTELTMTEKVKEGEALYGSVTAKEVAKLLSNQAGMPIAPKNIIGNFPIKTLGTHPITVQLQLGVEFQMSVVVLEYEEA
ncbi:MAG: 50S ribosomal protein L9 [Candidatus Andersenbacteria bacterium RIFCSPHIGHO2_02_FULL_45_11]|uniref:Large ribosomal subunit protein bL9 n=1 Tax=Candidatus Andersenbacteria bacterium RIFCSPHIGHO2_12_FULL_45_11 TaxID=1797281 RepID=A0A1G1X1Z7_9BACT|nr:MAG: 50S ribosomal protein L9 [Candidatus Andersenbacteria bacterium RIFCSPHIGHO2_01_FULL_46_36]OGY31896.1 MAG: 50S ribosomal protein L9 [Candidatus Andersenbacteria bacterium RIFCSPHIGHO2_02_FULL_45_11]OGY34035.1 MAG: 50S ribosomal protein L9 [Candidatus Andersenbacteria bacterium RIFCSPHIGHO2_12_FULL_45_11]